MTSQRPSDPQRLNLYAYVRGNPLVNLDPNGLDLYAIGAEAERYRKDLEKATGLKLKLDTKTGQITIAKEPKKLGADAQKIKDIISDTKNTVRIEAIRDTAGARDVRIGAFEGGGRQTLDYADIDKFGKQKGGSTPGSIAIHETTEAYEGITNPKALAAPNPFPDSHAAAIGYENAYRARNGLGARVGESAARSGNDVTVTIDYTTHLERITIDVTSPNQSRASKWRRSHENVCVTACIKLSHSTCYVAM
jgi:hypothetical protein